MIDVLRYLFSFEVTNKSKGHRELERKQEEAGAQLEDELIAFEQTLIGIKPQQSREK